MQPEQLGQAQLLDVLETPLALRSELRIALRHADGDTYYQLENKFTGKFFRLGVEEWEFASTLRPGVTPAQVLASTQMPLDASRAATVCMFLLHAGLAERVADKRSTPQEPPKLGFLKPFLGLLYKQVPLATPDRWLAGITPRLRWLFSAPAFAFWLALVIVAISMVSLQYERFLSESSSYFFPSSWVTLLIVWLSLKVIHECGHGIVCKKYGGTVGSAGVMLILLSPIAYIDVTSSWRFRSRWQRIATAAGGMYVEFAVAAAAAIVWACCGTTYTAHLAHHVVFTAGLSTLVFNANPLMRFDGYYILSDLLDVQNLYDSGTAAVRRCARRAIGLSRAASGQELRHPYLAITYGTLSAIWRVMMCVSLVLAASKMFHGAGVILAVLAAVLWFGLPLLRTIGIMYAERSNISFHRLLLVGFVLLLATVVLIGVPIPFGISVPAVVEYDPVQVVRADANGFVTRVHVTSGEVVQEGQPLLEVRDDEALAELKSVQLEIKQVEIESRVRLQFDDVSQYQAELEHLAALRQQEKMLAQVAKGLLVRSPSTGIVLDAYPEELLGRYTTEGAALISIGDENAKHVRLSIPEHHAERLFTRAGADAKVYLEGRLRSPEGARLTSVDPSASDRDISEHLLATNGGPLAVAVDSSDNSGGLRLIAPRFHGSVSLPAEAAAQFRAGERGVVRFHDRTETASAKVSRAVSKWISNKVTTPPGK